VVDLLHTNVAQVHLAATQDVPATTRRAQATPLSAGHRRVTVPLSRLLSLLTLERPPERRSRRDNFRVIVRNAQGEWRALRITSEDEAKPVRDQTQARIESIGIETWSREMRGRITESFFR
jgi:hypothetical protein